MIIANSDQHRTISDDTRLKLDMSMTMIGDISGICINLGADFDCRLDIIEQLKSDEHHYQLVSGHQRGSIADLNDAVNDVERLVISIKYDKPNDSGTLALGYLIYKGAKYSVRFVCWKKSIEQFALVASNELRGRTDVEKMKDLIGEDILEGAVSDLELLEIESNALLASLEGQMEEVQSIEAQIDSIGIKEMPEIVIPEKPISELGDLLEFRCGELIHRVICADATMPDSWEKVLLKDELIDLIVTDPPYNVNYKGKTSNSMTIQNDNMDSGEFEEFLKRLFFAGFDRLKQGGSVYVFYATTMVVEFRTALSDVVDWHYSQDLIWKKNAFVLGRQDYHWMHEPIMYGWKKGKAHNWYSDRKQTTVLEFDRPVRNDVHPTMKPIDLLTYLVLCSSEKGDVVADGCTGSGNILLACDYCNRTFRGVELDPSYMDAIVMQFVRYCKLNGKRFEVLKNGNLLSSSDIEKYLIKYG